MFSSFASENQTGMKSSYLSEQSMDVICRRTLKKKIYSVLLVILTAGWDEADDDGSGGARALHQYCDQNADHQASHWVRQDRVVLEDIPSHLTLTDLQEIELQVQTKFSTELFNNVELS